MGDVILMGIEIIIIAIESVYLAIDTNIIIQLESYTTYGNTTNNSNTNNISSFNNRDDKDSDVRIRKILVSGYAILLKCTA